ncbi:MAG: hypothetical protein ABR559_03375 [Gemmatimonadota bacterium]
MRTPIRLIACAIALSLTVACSKGEDDGDISPADTVRAEDGATTGIEAGTAEPMAVPTDTYELVVTNPMPHAMTVSSDFEGSVVELGAVAASGQQTFVVPAPPGATVTVIARDEAGSHSPTAQVTFPDGQTYTTWTIE